MSWLNNLKAPGQRVIELGGGANRHPAADVNVDVRAVPGVDFVVDLNAEEWPEIGSDEFDVALCIFCLEHVSFRSVPSFLKQTLRILKPGGKAIFVIPNTEAQIKSVLAPHSDEGDWKDGEFVQASRILFGGNDYEENTHRSYFSPVIAAKLFQDAGFVNVRTRPYTQNPETKPGDETDMMVEASRPGNLLDLPQGRQGAIVANSESSTASAKFVPDGKDSTPVTFVNAVVDGPPTFPPIRIKPPKDEYDSAKRAEEFGYAYFNGSVYQPFYLDYPAHQVTAEYVLARKPESVLELGCLVAGSPIVTKTGVLPIDSLEEGMEVFTHEGQFSKISRMTYRPYDGDIVVVEPRYSDGIPIKLTTEHPVYVVNVKKKFQSWKADIIGNPQWVPAEDLNKDDYWLAIPRPRKVNDLDIQPDFARLCGYYLAEGWCQKKKGSSGCGTGYTVSFCFRNEKEPFADDVRVLMKRFFGTTDGWIEKKEGEKAFKICFYSKTGYFQLGGVLGRGARNKSIPMEWVSGASDDALKQLVIGMYRGDGTEPKNDRYAYSTSSFSMSVSMRLVLMRLGIMTELSRCEPRVSSIRGKAVVGVGGWCVRASGCNYDAFADIMGQEHRVRTDGRSYWYGRKDELFFYIPIKRLTREHYTGLVYNMDVEEDHSYSHPVCTVHNCGRGYVLKRLQDAGVRAEGIDISKHCFMTRACDGIHQADVCKGFPPVWDMHESSFDLCFSIDFLDRVPERFVPLLAVEMERSCERGLHGLDFNAKAGGGDPTRCTVRSRSWWLERLPRGHEVIEKGEMERVQDLSKAYVQGDGKVKLNVGSAFSMYHQGWINIDVDDRSQFAQPSGYKFQKADIRNGLPLFSTGTVDLIFASHVFEHLTYREGMAFLKECRRLLKPEGAVRILVPDAGLLLPMYCADSCKVDEFVTLSDFDCINEECAGSVAAVGKLWSLLLEGHRAIYDAETLCSMLEESKFVPHHVKFRETKAGAAGEQMKRETIDGLPMLSCIVEGVPAV